MSTIKVTFAAIEGTQQHVTNTAQVMNAELADLKRTLAPMVETWQGQAREDYRAKQAQWDNAAADLNRVLTQIGTALGAAHDGYRQTESANAARWA